MLFKGNAGRLDAGRCRGDGKCRQLPCGHRGAGLAPRQWPLRRSENATTLRGDTAVWSVQRYSVKKLVQIHASHFPLIVKVTRACHDNDALELLVNQVLQIHDSARQRRVNAVDSFGRNLSIPADSPLYVTPTEGDRAGEHLMLAEAAVCLPVRVAVLRTTSDGDGNRVRVPTGQLLLMRSVVEDVFLRANAINGGWIDQSAVITIPSCLGTEFALAEGMRGATSIEWTDYKNMFSRSVRHVNFDLTQGPSQIFILGTPRSVIDVSSLLLFDNALVQSQQTTSEHGQRAKETSSEINHEDRKANDKIIWLQCDRRASCSSA